MNVEQLLQEVDEFLSDLGRQKIIKTFGEFNDALDQVIANPGNVEIQNKFKDVRNSLFEKLSSLTFWDKDSRKYEIAQLFPKQFAIASELRSFIERALSENTITLAVGLAALRKRKEQLDGFVASLNSLKSSTLAIGFAIPKLAPGDCTVRISVPFEYFHNNLGEMADKFESIDKMLKLFSTVFEGSRLDFEIVKLSTSKPKLQIKMNWKTALGILVAIKFSLELLNNVVDIKLKYEELLKLGVNNQMIHSVDKIVEKRVNDGLLQLRQQILADQKEYMSGSAPAEVDKTLDQALKLLLDKIQNGVTFDVLAIAPEQKEENSDTAVISKAYSRINELNIEIKTLNPPTHPVIALPVPE